MDDDFSFNYCPECGGQNLKPTKWIYGGGKGRKCDDCGKQFQVIREDDNED